MRGYKQEMFIICMIIVWVSLLVSVPWWWQKRNKNCHLLNGSYSFFWINWKLERIIFALNGRELCELSNHPSSSQIAHLISERVWTAIWRVSCRSERYFLASASAAAPSSNRSHPQSSGFYFKLHDVSRPRPFISEFWIFLQSHC